MQLGPLSARSVLINFSAHQPVVLLVLKLIGLLSMLEKKSQRGGISTMANRATDAGGYRTPNES